MATEPRFEEDLIEMQTPGHTPGHCSLAVEDQSILFAGDIVGTIAGSLTRGPAPFIADAEEAERSLRRVAGLEFDRVLFGHGAEIENPVHELRSLLTPELGLSLGDGHMTVQPVDHVGRERAG